MLMTSFPKSVVVNNWRCKLNIEYSPGQECSEGLR